MNWLLGGVAKRRIGAVLMYCWILELMDNKIRERQTPQQINDGAPNEFNAQQGLFCCGMEKANRK